jgi:hypothetical protein
MAQRLLRSAVALDFRVCAALAGLAAFLVYLRTLAPTVMWYDMGEFTTASYVLGIAHNTGYPLYILLGKLFTLFPVGDVAYRVNLMSAVFASLTVAFIFLIIAELTRNRMAALIGALTVAFSSTLWASANWAESYPLNAFSTALITWLLLRWRTTGQVWYLRLTLLAFGLSIGNHRLIVLLAPGMLLFLWAFRRRLSTGHWLQLALLFLLGLSVYLYLPIRGSQEPALSWAHPANLNTYWRMFLTGNSGGEFWNFAFLGRLDILALFPLHEVTAFGLILAAIGLVSALKRDRLFAAYSLLLCASIGFLVLTYMIHNVFNYFIPAYLMVGVWIGYGVDAILSFVTRRAGLGASQLSVVRPGLRWSLAALVLASLPLVLFARSLPVVDRSHDYSAYDFARTTLERVEPNSTIVADTWAASPLWYVQLVEGYRRDVFVSPVLSARDEDVGAFVAGQFDKGRPVYVAAGLRDDLDAIRDKYYVQPVVLNGIETMLTNVLPKPEYKDDLVPRGSFYRVLQDPPTLSVGEVPPSARLDMPFGDAVSLVGFSTDPGVAKRGDVLKVSYYWRLETPAEEDLQATVFFTNRDETLQLRYGFPLWWQSHELGGGLYPTSQWDVGEIVKEEYYVLVPRDLEPGPYYVRMRVQNGTPDLTTSAAGDEAASSARLIDDVLPVE